MANNVAGGIVIKKTWPGMARTMFHSHDRYLKTYMQPYPGYYFTSDGCTRDGNGHLWITGHVDDVINPSGHRIGTAEVESALVGSGLVAEAAVVGFTHDVKGEWIAAFVILMMNQTDDENVLTKLRNSVRQAIGAFATPDVIIITPGLPKTRSGKIMRRILRKLLIPDEANQLGDISTLADPSIVETLRGLCLVMN